MPSFEYHTSLSTNEGKPVLVVHVSINGRPAELHLGKKVLAEAARHVGLTPDDLKAEENATTTAHATTEEN